MSSLAGKKILCVGGNGYIGNYFASRLIQAQASVQVLCRSGPKHKYPENKKIQWLIGDIFQPQRFQSQINDADVIVHTVGTLFDTSIRRKQKPGGPGTYQAMNRDSVKSLLNALQVKNKKIFYLSAVGHPPFIHRYAQTKEQAQQLLLESDQDPYIFKPGFVYNWEHRRWSIPLKYNIQLWNKIYPFLHKMTFNGTHLQRVLKEFQQSEPTSLERMGDALLEIVGQGLPSSFDKIIKNDKINQLSHQYRERMSKKSNM